jgi:hypothetical protein
MFVKVSLKTLTMATGTSDQKKRFLPDRLQLPIVATVVLKDASQVRHSLLVHQH